MAKATAKTNYALRALVQLASVEPQRLTGDQLSAAQGIPARFLQTILADLTRARLVDRRRGAGGYWLTRPPKDISIAEVVSAVEGKSMPAVPEEYAGLPLLGELWELVRVNEQAILGAVTLADLVAGQLPDAVQRLTTFGLAKP